VVGLAHLMPISAVGRIWKRWIAVLLFVDSMILRLLACSGIRRGVSILMGANLADAQAGVAYGMMDVPNARSSHTRPTPRGGGMGSQ